MIDAPIISLRAVSKSYFRGDEIITVLEAVNLEIKKGAFEAFMGPSGSGKSTLLNLVSGLDRPTSGSVEVGGRNLAELSDSTLAQWRSEHVGFIFQLYNLIPVLSAAENIELPLLLSPLNRKERVHHVEAALALVGLSKRAKHRPSHLSGGEQQRVAIARAIVTDPDIIIADEPTGDLDRKGAEQILDLLQSLHERLKKTIILVTHDPRAADRAKTIRHLEKGMLR